MKTFQVYLCRHYVNIKETLNQNAAACKRFPAYPVGEEPLKFATRPPWLGLLFPNLAW